MPMTLQAEMCGGCGGILIKKMRNKIQNFIESGREDYLQFWLSLFPARGSQIINNSNRKITLPKQTLKFMPNGIYDNVCEIDFEKFSFNFLIDHSNSDELTEIINTLLEFPESYRRKRLRIYLYQSLLSIESTLFNPDLYVKVREEMINTLNKTEKLIKSHNKQVLSKLWDSFSFVSSEKDGIKIQKEINRVLKKKVKLKIYLRIVSFLNVNYYKFRDGFGFNYTTKKDPEYEKLKEEIVKLLMNDKIKEAINLTEENDRISKNAKKTYLKILEKIQLKNADIEPKTN